MSPYAQLIELGIRVSFLPYLVPLNESYKTRTWLRYGYTWRLTFGQGKYMGLTVGGFKTWSSLGFGLEELCLRKKFRPNFID